MNVSHSNWSNLKSVVGYFLIYFKRCAQAIGNKETWTGYLSLVFSIVCFQFHLFHKLHVCYVCLFFNLCMYIFCTDHTFFPSCKYSRFAISYLKIKHDKHMHHVWHFVSLSVICFILTATFFIEIQLTSTYTFHYWVTCCWQSAPSLALFRSANGLDSLTPAH